MKCRQWVYLLLLAFLLGLAPFNAFAEEAVEPEEPIAAFTEEFDEEADESADNPEHESETESVETVESFFEAEPETEEEFAEDYAEEIEVLSDDSAPDTDNEALLGAYFEKLLFNKPLLRRPVGATTLQGTDLVIYQKLSEHVSAIARQGGSTVCRMDVTEIGAQLSWTQEELGGISILSGGKVTDEARKAVSERLDTGNTRLILSALKQDFPCEMYWYDKTTGTAKNISYSIAASKSRIWITAGTVSYSFAAAEAYGDGYYVDEAQAARAQSAVENAHAIVSAYAAWPDEEKLYAYKNEICALASYNVEAAAGQYPYGDPWQAIYVFDGDASTNVVCEGYAKAFEYLCDLSAFSSGAVSCVCVTGTMNGGGHMWNIVTLDDGANYLADVTNCDTGTIGASDLLFLVGYSTGGLDGYGFVCSGLNAFYVYDEETLALLSEAELTLAPADSRVTWEWSWAEDYSSASVSLDDHRIPPRIVTVEGVVQSETTPASCTEPGLTVYTASAEYNGMLFTDSKRVEVPRLEHNFTWEEVDWGTDAADAYGAYFTYTCTSCGEEREVFVPGTYHDFKGERSYTATDSYGNTVTDGPVRLHYAVAFEGQIQPTQYRWGESCLLTYGSGEEPRAWYAVDSEGETLLADGISSYSFAVTQNMTIVTRETQNTEPQAVVAVKLSSQTPGRAVFDAMWSIPYGAKVTSATIYRGSSDVEKTVDVETLIQKGAPFDTGLLVRNGSYRLNLVELTPTKYQHVVIQITYTLEGETEPRTLTSEVLRVLPNGGK